MLDAAGVQRQHVLPSGVAEELDRLGVRDLAGFDVVDIEELEGLTILADWQQRLGTASDGRDGGEAWVAALAQMMGGVAIIDDRQAHAVIERYSELAVHGVLWAISRGVVEGRAPGPHAYSGLCDQMLGARERVEPGSLRWPFDMGGYVRWFERNKAVLGG
ncbi:MULTISPECIES: hypothetical protein [Actinomyces]|uniref:Uncharacterized protein n=1 Tax=Actinomyces respiraculi TaxID=2744574 RepID=A0A7T0PWK3_9ACTO|nr:MULTISPECIES: hypothetical protein [Actinomyces]QPL05814.1 hypothetical protein ID810_02245 [Actinomyces respiraculi]